MEKTETTPADGLEASASPRQPQAGVGTQTAGAGSIPDADNPKTIEFSVPEFLLGIFLGGIFAAVIMAYSDHIFYMSLITDLRR